MPQFTVALVADPEAPFTQMASPEEWSRPWHERRTTTVDADDADTLASVLERAAEKLDVRPPPDHHTKRYSARSARIAFWRPEHDAVGITANRAVMHELTVVDRDGRLRFGVHDLRTISVEQLLESARRGVIDGDPLRPYLIVEIGYGDAPPIDWPTFKAAWDVAYDVVQVVADVGGAAAILKSRGTRCAIGSSAARKASKLIGTSGRRCLSDRINSPRFSGRGPGPPRS